MSGHNFLLIACCMNLITRAFFFQAFSQMNTKLSTLRDACRENKRQWQKLADDYKAQVCDCVLPCS